MSSAPLHDKDYAGEAQQPYPCQGRPSEAKTDKGTGQSRKLFQDRGLLRRSIRVGITRLLGIGPLQYNHAVRKTRCMSRPSVWGRVSMSLEIHGLR